MIKQPPYPSFFINPLPPKHAYMRNQHNQYSESTFIFSKNLKHSARFKG